MRLLDDSSARERWLRVHGPQGGTAVRQSSFGGGADDAGPDDAPVDGTLLPKDAPGPGADWVPLGPTTATGGMASDRPPITGRVRSLAFAPGGGRGYAGTAGAGVWMSLDAGVSWSALDPWINTPDAALVPASGGLALGSIGVQFGNTVDDDVVLVGLGEPKKSLGLTVRRFGRAGGAGPRLWTNEATNLGRFFSYRLLCPPPSTAGSRNRAWLASTSGLHERPAAAPFASWTAIPLPAPFSTPLTVGGQLPPVTDVVLLVDAGVEWLYAAVQGRGVVRIQLVGGSAVGQPVVACTGITQSMTLPERRKYGRTSLAASEDAAPRVYALAQVELGSARARLFRMAHTAANTAFTRVVGVPGSLWFVGGGDQGDYDNTVAVVPQAVPAPATATDEVVVAGSAVMIDGEWQAAAYRGRVRRVAGVWTFSPTLVGRGAHADVHCAAFFRRNDATLDRDDLWLGTDGGIFRSQAAIESGRFQPSHGGISSVQLTFLAQHPTVPAFLLAGSQDNGLLIGTGEPTWARHRWAGDAGGVAVDPVRPRWMWQWTQSTLYASRPPGTAVPPPAVAFPPTANAALKTAETRATGFYGRLAVVEVPAVSVAVLPTARLAFGTKRVWVSNDWGATWRSLPSGTNALASAAPQTRDQLDGQNITAVAWASPSVVHAATSMGVYTFTNVGAGVVVSTVQARRSGTANRGLRRAGEPANAVPPAFQTTTAVPVANVGPLPPDFVVTALAAEDAAGARLYVAISSATSPELLWYLRPGLASSWFPCTLAAFLGGSTGVHAVLVDPAHQDEVYVGTDVGVYQGKRTDHDPAAPTWAWAPFSQGLPEAAISDLALWAPVGAGVRLLRASTFGRGAWEIDLERATGRDARPPREPEVYVRVSGTDDGRRVPGVTRLPDPLDPTPPPLPGAAAAVPRPRASGYVESPDVAVVRARARVGRAWPVGALTGADRQAWRVAASTWDRPLRPTTGAFGAADRAVWQAIQRERVIPLSAAMNRRTWEATFKGVGPDDPDHVRYLDRYGRELAPTGPAVPVGTLRPPRWQVVDPPPGVNRVLVHVRTRGPLSVAAGRTEVVVLWQVVAPVTPIPALGAAPALPHPGVVLPPLPARWREGVRTRTLGLLSTDGWAVAGGGFASTDLGALNPLPLDPENPRVVGVDLTLTGRAVGDLVALFVVVRCQDDLLPGPADPAAPDPLRDVATMVTTESRAALRVVQVRDPTT